jgi:hypothetical protein
MDEVNFQFEDLPGIRKTSEPKRPRQTYFIDRNHEKPLTVKGHAPGASAQTQHETGTGELGAGGLGILTDIHERLDAVMTTMSRLDAALHKDMYGSSADKRHGERGWSGRNWRWYTKGACVLAAVFVAYIAWKMYAVDMCVPTQDQSAV